MDVASGRQCLNKLSKGKTNNEITDWMLLDVDNV